jgi:hypothetical protein
MVIAECNYMKRRSFLHSSLLGYCNLVIPNELRGFDLPNSAVPPPQPDRLIEFEEIGGVGDGDPDTGRGTDNASAFARAERLAQQGYGIKFKARACYKTTEQINVHNMYWIGDGIFKPTIFGWFSARGKKLIGRSRNKNPSSVCIIGIAFHRCGPFAEHGIVIDNIEKLYFDISVTSEPGSQGGAIGISPFFPENRHSQNCFIKARINNSGDFGIQLGSVSGVTIDLIATDCYREVIGIEPIVFGSVKLGRLNPVDDIMLSTDVDLSSGDPILYCNGTGPRGPLIPGQHYFVVKEDDHSLSLANSRLSAAKNHKLCLGDLDGLHYFARSSIVKDVVVRYAHIVDNKSRRPTLYASTLGYVIVTGNSGGLIENIKFESMYIEGNQSFPKAESIGVYVQGVSNLKLKNIRVRGCDNAIVVSNGWLNGMFDENGLNFNLESSYSKLISSNIGIIDPDLIDFRNNGIVFKGEGGILHGGKFSSRFRDAMVYSKELG